VSAPIVEFFAVSVGNSRHGAPLVPDIDWSVHEGDCWVVTGSQESGKSTLLQTAAGLRAPLSGQILWWGDPAPAGDARAVAWRRRIGMVFDGEGRLFRSMSVAENIALPLAYHENIPLAAALEKVKPLIAACHLESEAGRMPGRLNRGAARMAAIARAMALKPEILFIDDPFAGADPVQSRICRRLIGDLAKGHPWFGGRPLTLVLSAASIRPWIEIGRQFAVARAAGWRTFADPDELMTSEDTTVHKLFSMDSDD
jgi:ABC-type transporter Mla maintaining outer membrane lipid asymmetry ATPase subunit MlaF